MLDAYYFITNLLFSPQFHLFLTPQLGKQLVGERADVYVEWGKRVNNIEWRKGKRKLINQLKKDIDVIKEGKITYKEKYDQDDDEDDSDEIYEIEETK
ncbi:MAG: hypothetical protein EZS28_051822, partial [Streblomastix strix]